MNTLLFFDTETTGLPLSFNAPVSDLDNWPRLIQLSWIVTTENGEELKRENYIIKPDGFTVPKEASDINGITTERAMSEGADLSLVLDAFVKDVKEAAMVIGHNVSFDQNIVGSELLRAGRKNVISNKPSCCTMKSTIDFCRIPNPKKPEYFKYPRLQELHKKLFGTSFANAHDSSADTEATRKCYFELKKQGLI